MLASSGEEGKGGGVEGWKKGRVEGWKGRVEGQARRHSPGSSSVRFSVFVSLMTKLSSQVPVRSFF